jgi:hypothetical protein
MPLLYNIPTRSEIRMAYTLATAAQKVIVILLIGRMVLQASVGSNPGPSQPSGPGGKAGSEAENLPKQIKQAESIMITGCLVSYGPVFLLVQDTGHISELIGTTARKQLLGQNVEVSGTRGNEAPHLAFVTETFAAVTIAPAPKGPCSVAKRLVQQKASSGSTAASAASVSSAARIGIIAGVAAACAAVGILVAKKKK